VLFFYIANTYCQYIYDEKAALLIVFNTVPGTTMNTKTISYIAARIWQAFLDLFPIIVVIGFFQIFIIRQPLPDLYEMIAGSALVVIGLSMFIQGLEMALFPIGESMAQELTRKGSLFWLLLFAFTLGFSTTVAEPALIAIAQKAAEVAQQGGLLPDSSETMQNYAFGLRMTVAVSVGFSILLGVLRILLNWPIHYMIISGYVLVMGITTIAPKEIIGIAYDAGGVTTSTITVPLVTALGVGLATVIKGRNPLLDGFGLIAFASLLPMIFVMGYGIIYFGT